MSEVSVGQRPAFLGDQAHLQHAGAKVQVGVMPGRIGEPADLLDELQAGGEIARAIEREGHRPQHPPVVDPVGVVELASE
jgi:hypothetical protein